MPLAADIFYSGDRSILDRLPIILIHGAGGSHLDWPRELRQLANRQVLAIDLPGHGRAPPPGRDSIEAYAESVFAFLEALAIARAIIIGHSMGGAVALMLALTHAEHVAGLGLISTGAKLRVSTGLLNALKTDPNAANRQILAQSVKDQTGLHLTSDISTFTSSAPADITYHDFRACDQFDIRTRLAEIHTPVCVIAGSQDAMTPVSYSTYLAEGINGATLSIIPGAGHMVTLEQPLAVANDLTHWLSTIPSIWVQ